SAARSSEARRRFPHARGSDGPPKPRRLRVSRHEGLLVLSPKRQRPRRHGQRTPGSSLTARVSSWVILLPLVLSCTSTSTPSDAGSPPFDASFVFPCPDGAPLPNSSCDHGGQTCSYCPPVQQYPEQYRC